MSSPVSITSISSMSIQGIHEFQHAELEALKEKIANDMGFELVGHRLELFGRKIK